ncbi:transposase [Streptomyces nogalater]|uniref:transposase n=1 Tax=Streptomyces nogalater TaxID=38314 RepID=UPI0031E38BC1
MHLAVEQGQKPLSVVIRAGQRGDSPQFEPVLEAIRVPRLGLGRPRKRPDRVRADKAYDSRGNRSCLRNPCSYDICMGKAPSCTVWSTATARDRHLIGVPTCRDGVTPCARCPGRRPGA